MWSEYVDKINNMINRMNVIFENHLRIVQECFENYLRIIQNHSRIIQELFACEGKQWYSLILGYLNSGWGDQCNLQYSFAEVQNLHTILVIFCNSQSELQVELQSVL